MHITSAPGPRPDQVIVRLEGDLDLYASVSFANAMLEHFAAGKKRLLLNFRDVRYLDSSGVGALIRLLQKAKASGGDLSLVELGGMPRKVLEMSNMLSILRTYKDEATVLSLWGGA